MFYDMKLVILTQKYVVFDGLGTDAEYVTSFPVSEELLTVMTTRSWAATVIRTGMIGIPE